METKLALFDENLRVLVVDDDPVCRKIITRMLHHCNYKVTEVAKATEGLETLKNNPKSFDMVIMDTRNDMDFLSLMVNIIKIDSIPVILVSGLDDNSTLIQGVLQGADEIISKPVSLSKIKTLWQHVYRRRRKRRLDNESLPLPESGPLSSSWSQEEAVTENEDESGQGKRKKTRVRWQGSLQEKFLEAVRKLGGPKEAMPKKIIELMNVPVSRECVASHLQKYRKQKWPFLLPQNDTNFVVSSPILMPPQPSHQPCYNYGRYELDPEPSPAASMATHVNLTFSGDPWHDSEVLESAFLSGLQPEVDEWVSEDLQTVANGAMLSAK